MFNQYNINAQRAARFGLEAVTGAPLTYETSRSGQVTVCCAITGAAMDSFTPDDWRQIIADGTRSDTGKGYTLSDCVCAAKAAASVIRNAEAQQ
jgi:hypothetical protein